MNINKKANNKMKTYIIPESEVENYRSTILTAKHSCVEESQIEMDLRGYEQLSLEEAKKNSKIGDCLLIGYRDDKNGNMLMPFQVVDKHVDENGEERCTLMSYYLLEQRAFDQKTNVWRDCELRRYLNSNEFLGKLDPEFVKCIKPKKVHTDNYVTEDKVWIPSHEEIGFVDKDKIFKPNVGAETFEYYKETAE